jgi:putative phage-type endonuclease
MKKELVQGSPEWLEMRKSYVGASDAPIILGDSPWKTAYQLWEEKLGLREPPETNAAMQRGNELEPIAREAYNQYTGLFCEPAVMFHPDHKWMMASLDGIALDHSMVVEIKCPGQKDHDTAKSGSVPQKYVAQLQHQLAVCGLNVLHYFSYRDGEFHLVEVERNEEYIQRLYSEEGNFWKKVRNFEAPDLSNRDILERNDERWLQAANAWKSIYSDLKDVEAKEKQARNTLIDLSGEHSCCGGGVRLRKSIRKGSVNYKAIPELQNVNLNNYRDSPIPQWRISES